MTLGLDTAEVDEGTDASASPLTRIARLPPQDNPQLLEKSQAQVVLLDLYQRVGPLGQHIAEGAGGIWLRHARPFEVGSRVIVHIILPEQFYPVTLEGIVAKIREADTGHPWILVWLDEADREGRQLLELTLKDESGSR